MSQLCRPIPVGSWVHGRHEWGRLRPDWSWRPKTLPSILTRYLWSVLCRHMGQHTILTLTWGAHVFGSWSSSGDRPGTSWERKLDPARPGVCPTPPAQILLHLHASRRGKMGMLSTVLISVPVVLLADTWFVFCANSLPCQQASGSSWRKEISFFTSTWKLTCLEVPKVPGCTLKTQSFHTNKD